MTAKPASGPRCAAFVGPYLSGKTTLLESVLVATGAVTRKGSIRDGNTVGDSAPEARARQMSVEVNIATTDYLGEEWTFLDCPGSVELLQDGYNAMLVADTVVVVCDPDPQKARAAAPILKHLSQHGIPHMVFINKMDLAEANFDGTIEALRTATDKPLVVREAPIRNGEKVVGFVDLTSGRAYAWKPGSRSEETPIPDAVGNIVDEARTRLLEDLSNFDDALLESLLEDKVPPMADLFAVASKAYSEGNVIPVFFGSADSDSGITRLLKALRHECPAIATTAGRLQVKPDGEPLAVVFKTVTAAQTGKLSFARVLRGELADGSTVNDERIAGVYKMFGSKQEKLGKATAGQTVGLGRLDAVKTGATLSPSGKAEAVKWPAPLKPLYALAIYSEQRGDEVKISGALAKLTDEDTSFTYEPNPETGDLVVWGQGEQHLQIAIDRIKNRNKLQLGSRKPQVPYKETIRKPVSQHGRHKKQSGGHGQFGDVHLDIKPMARGEGFVFGETVTGGAVPRQYFPAVEAGVKDYLNRGPLGFPVVDVSVTLTDGQYHDVDSSEMAFKTAAIIAMKEGMPKCSPVLLEPIYNVAVSVPSEFTSKIQRLVSGRRGQILGFDAKPGWQGWDEVKVQMPQAEVLDLINELRSITQGVGTFTWEFDHLQPLTGKEADDVVAARQAALAQS